MNSQAVGDAGNRAGIGRGEVHRRRAPEFVTVPRGDSYKFQDSFHVLPPIDLRIKCLQNPRFVVWVLLLASLHQRVRLFIQTGAAR